MERTLHALVLKRKDIGESDRRLTVLTQESGVLDLIARGAKKAASRLAGCSEPLAACILHVAEGKRNGYITQAQPVTSFPGLRSDYERLSMALALAELAAAVLPHEQPAADAFALIVSSLRYLESHSKAVVALVWAEVQLLVLSGFMPELQTCVVTGEPIRETPAFVSPHAGGYLSTSAALRYTDRFQVKAEVLYGLVALQELQEPPANLKFAMECLTALYPFWRAIADYALPANQALVQEMLES